MAMPLGEEINGENAERDESMSDEFPRSHPVDALKVGRQSPDPMN